MAAVLDLETGTRIVNHGRPHLRLVDENIDHRRVPSSVYLRRRVMVALGLVGLLLGVYLLAVHLASPVPESAGDTSVHVVRSGETLWSIAQTVRPDSDPRSTIGAIVELNSTDGAPFDADAPLLPGQAVLVPPLD